MSARQTSIGSVVFILFFSFLLQTPKIHAVVGFQPVNPDELKMTSEPLAPGAPAIILYRQVDRNDMGRTSHGGVTIWDTEPLTERFEDNYLRIKILTEAGRKYADIEIPFSAQFDEIANIQARTIHPDGSITVFNGNVLSKTIFKNAGMKYEAKTLTLPDVQVGSIIEYFYTIAFKGGWIHDSHWIISQDLFTKHAKFTLRPHQGDTTLKLRWREHMAAGMPSVQQNPDELVWLAVDNVPAFRSEDFMPPENDLKARVDFSYLKTYEITELDANKYWQKIGKRRNGEVEDFADRSGAIQQLVKETLSSVDSDEVKLKKLYSRVQSLRNTSFEPSRTPEEKKREPSTTPAHAEDVLKQGYGNRDQLNWLYLALVRAAGFEAYSAWVSDRRNYIFNPQSMDSGRLDRSLVLVKLEGKELYFEPGAEFTPFGMLDWAETGVQGLRMDKNGGTWIQTPVPDSSLSQVQRKADLKLTATGDLEGTITVRFTGLEGLKRRIDERNEDDIARKKHLEDELKRTIPSATEAHLSNTPDWKSSDAPLEAEFNVAIRGWVARGGRLAMCPLGLFGATERHVFDAPERTHPIYFEYPAQRLDDIVLELPAGWQVASIPQAVDQNYRVVAYGISVENNKTSIHVKRKLDINIISMETNYYSPIRSFFQGVRAGDSQQVVLQSGTTVSSN
jgi:hypothetical protein